MSTYIRRPPYWEGALAGERTLRGMRPLAILPDNITTDHLSPSNAILAVSAAGEYLAKMGLPEEDFNSYATHRGDHLTAQRATFANPKLFNEMGEKRRRQRAPRLVRPRRTRRRNHAHVGSHRNLYEPQTAAHHHCRCGLWSRLKPRLGCKGVRLAGVEAIVAEGFERIHRTNLIGMGVLPLQFKPDTNRHTLQLDGTETYDVVGERTPRCDLTLVIHRKTAKPSKFPLPAASILQKKYWYMKPAACCNGLHRILEGNAA